MQLVVEQELKNALPQIAFRLGDMATVVQRDDYIGGKVVATLMRSWLEGWLKKRGIEYAVADSAQMPPDFFLDPDDRTHDLLEVKAFNRSASPGFDIAEFAMYSEEIINEPYMLDVDYLIFGYDMSDEGEVTIKDVWMKKVWEITRRMGEWPLNMQISRNVVKKIRPGTWYSSRPRDFLMFRCMEDFLAAVEETVYQNPVTRNKGPQWKNRFITAYENFYGKKLDFPHWGEIKDSYLVNNGQ